MRKFTQEWWHSLPPERAGKEVEKLIEAALNERSLNQSFAYHRMPDAKAARGALKAQPGDYLYTCRSRSGFIEVKALKDPRRLPAARLTQLATLKKFELAGMKSYVVVFQYMEGVWRVASIASLQAGQPSWLVTEWATYPDLPKLLNAIFGE